MKAGAGLQSRVKKNMKVRVEKIREKRYLADAWLVLFFLPFIGQAIFVFILSYMLGKDRVEDR